MMDVIMMMTMIGAQAKRAPGRVIRMIDRTLTKLESQAFLLMRILS